MAGCNGFGALRLGHEGSDLMKKIVLIMMANAALGASPAQGPAATGATASSASESTHSVRDDQAKTSGDHRELQCSKDDPYIEYRDCVNASTRDNNAKVRMAQAATAARRA